MLANGFVMPKGSKKRSIKNIRINSDLVKNVGIVVVIVVLIVACVFAFSLMLSAIDDRNEKIDNLQNKNPTWIEPPVVETNKPNDAPTWNEPPVEETNKPNDVPTWNEPPKSESNEKEPSKDSTSSSETTTEVIDLRDKSKFNDVVVNEPFTEPNGEVVDLRNNDKSSSSDVIENEKDGLVAPPGGW